MGRGYNHSVKNSLEKAPTIEEKPPLPAYATPTPSSSAATPHLLGIPFHNATILGVLAKVNDYIAQGGSHQICLSNAYTVSLCWKDLELRGMLDRADLVLADGMSIVWGGRLIGVRLRCRVAGPDLAEAMCAQAETKGQRLFFLGSTSENLAQLKITLLKKWPRLQIAGMYSPPMCEKLTADVNDIIFEKLRLAKPDILFVGMSTPKQEKWIGSNIAYLEVPVAIGIGAAFDFISGRIPRAPLIFQRAGIEWLYRLWREPRRLWKRYLLGNAIFLAHLGVAWLRLRFPFLKPRS